MAFRSAQVLAFQELEADHLNPTEFVGRVDQPPRAPRPAPRAPRPAPSQTGRASLLRPARTGRASLPMPAPSLGAAHTARGRVSARGSQLRRRAARRAASGAAAGLPARGSSGSACDA
jgi:hypothetical protein